MGGTVLEYEAKTIYNQGRRDGAAEGHQAGVIEGHQAGVIEGHQAGVAEGEARGTLNTLFALVDGTVKFEHVTKDKKRVSVYVAE